MKRTEMYKKLRGKKVSCISCTRYKSADSAGIFKKVGRMSFTVTHMRPLRRLEPTKTKYYLYPDDEIEDSGEYITVRRGNLGLLFIFYA